MTKKKYPEEIYPKFGFKTDAFGRLTQWTTCNSDFERAYDLGFRDGSDKERLEASNPLVGWSNLTAAIADGERIDWDALDGLEAKCVHPELGTLTHKLVRDQPEPPYSWTGWGDADSMISHWDTVFECAWQGSSGWTLWIKGDIPLRKQTADELALGTCFRARYQKGALTHTYAWAQVVEVLDIAHVACFNEHFTHVIASYHPADIEVLEVYGVGIFQAPKENA
ncbi:hypothetical protein [Rothia nasimurium]|uniref:hypothetical protein n=1 Tax=Rothia nasimurium TaxID=85336 RepID=UPI001F43B970|nr:hypothetical protein [Rothia nasimurium]